MPVHVNATPVAFVGAIPNAQDITTVKTKNLWSNRESIRNLVH